MIEVEQTKREKSKGGGGDGGLENKNLERGAWLKGKSGRKKRRQSFENPW